MSRFGIFKISGVDYDLDELTLDEMEAIEDFCNGVPFGELNYRSAKTMRAIATVLMRRTNPDITPADVGSVRMIDFLPADEAVPALPPDEGLAPASESELEPSGVPV